MPKRTAKQPASTPAKQPACASANPFADTLEKLKQNQEALQRMAAQTGQMSEDAEHFCDSALKMEKQSLTRSRNWGRVQNLVDHARRDAGEQEAELTNVTSQYRVGITKAQGNHRKEMNQGKYVEFIKALDRYRDAIQFAAQYPQPPQRKWFKNKKQLEQEREKEQAARKQFIEGHLHSLESLTSSAQSTYKDNITTIDGETREFEKRHQADRTRTSGLASATGSVNAHSKAFRTTAAAAASPSPAVSVDRPGPRETSASTKKPNWLQRFLKTILAPFIWIIRRFWHSAADRARYTKTKACEDKPQSSYSAMAEHMPAAEAAPGSTASSSFSHDHPILDAAFRDAQRLAKDSGLTRRMPASTGEPANPKSEPSSCMVM